VREREREMAMEMEVELLQKDDEVAAKWLKLVSSCGFHFPLIHK